MLRRKLTAVSILPRLVSFELRGGAVDAEVDRLGSVSMSPFLAADVGGTHTRVALVRARHGSNGLEVLAWRKFVCADFSGLPELLGAFVKHDAPLSAKRCVLACAGQAVGDEVLHDNLAWPIRLSQLRSELGFDDIAVLNDFEALGYAFDAGLVDGARLLCGPDLREAGPVLVIGPGTGLGAAVWLPNAAGGRVLTTEAGQMDFAPNTNREREILACLAPHGGYVAYERVVSGPGLLTLYLTLCRLQRTLPRLASSEAVTAAALTYADAQAVEAVEIFCATLGSFAGGLAMAFMAAGGVYLAGGFLYSMFGQLQRSAFAERFLHERSVQALLSRVPVRVMEHGRHGVLGAANWYLKRAAFDEAARHLAACELAT